MYNETYETGLATGYVQFYPIELNNRSGSSPKPRSNVLFPGALPLASAGVGGYMDILGWIKVKVSTPEEQLTAPPQDVPKGATGAKSDPGGLEAPDNNRGSLESWRY